MKIDIIVPAAGESVTEADIASWSKEDGDYVEMDDVLQNYRMEKKARKIISLTPTNYKIKTI